MVEATQQAVTTAGQVIRVTVAASDPDGDPLSYSATLPTNGTLQFTGNQFFYTANAGFVGTDRFSVVVRDDNGGVATQTVSINVLQANEAPVLGAPNLALETDFETAVTLRVSASDPDGDALTYTPLDPINGTVLNLGGGNFRYTPDDGFSGADSFTVRVSDGKGGTATQVVTVEVGEENLAPVIAASTGARTLVDQSVSILIEADDPEGDPIAFEAAGADHGTVVLGQDGVLTYTPDDGFVGNDAFTVTVRDDEGKASSMTVDVRVFETRAELLATDPSQFSLLSVKGFAGAIGGSGTIVGADGFQRFELLDEAGRIVFDPSLNKGGDAIEFAKDAEDYIVQLGASSVIIKDADNEYVIPVGPEAIRLIFADGARALKLDVENGTVLLGNQEVGSEAAIITAQPSLSQPLQQVDPDAVAALQLQPGAGLTIDGNYNVVGTPGEETLGFAGGKVTVDGSFNGGKDEIEFDRAASEFSAYISGSRLVLFDGADMITLPIGPKGILLDFDGDERIALLDTAIGAVRVGDEIITATTMADAVPLGGGFSLDQGTLGTRATIDLDPEAAYQLYEDPDVSSFVEVLNFNEDDEIVVLDGELDDYSFTHTGEDLKITQSDGSTVNSIIIRDVDVAPGEFIFDAESAIEAVGWNFITMG